MLTCIQICCALDTVCTTPLSFSGDVALVCSGFQSFSTVSCLFAGSGILGGPTEVAFSPAEGFASFVEALKSNFGQPREQNTTTVVPETSAVDRRPSSSLKSVAEPEMAQPGNPFTQFIDSMNSTFPPEKKKSHSTGESAREAESRSASDSAPDSSSLGSKAEGTVQSVKDAAAEGDKAGSSDNIVTQFVDSMNSTFPPEKNNEDESAAQPASDSASDSSSPGRKAEDTVQSVKDAAAKGDKAGSSDNIVTQFVDSMNSTFPPEKSNEDEPAAQPASDSAPDSSSPGGKAEDTVQSVKDTASEGDKPEPSSNPVTQFVDSMNSTFPPEKGEGSAAGQSDSDSGSNSNSRGGKTDSAAQSVTDAVPEGDKSESSNNPVTQFLDSMNSTFPPEKSSGDSAQPVSDSDGRKAEKAAQSVSEAASDSSSLGDKAEGTVQSVADAAAESDKPSGNPITQFLDSMKSTFPPEKSSGEAAQPVSAAVSDSSMLGSTAGNAAQSVTDTTAEVKKSEPADNLIAQLTDNTKSTLPLEQDAQSAGDSAQQAASDNAGQAARNVSDAASDGLDAVQKSPDSLKAINNEAAEAQQSEAVSGITNFVDSAKEKLQPDQNPTEAASAAAQSVSDAAPDSTSFGGKAESAAKSVSDAASDSKPADGKAADKVQSVSDSVADSSSLGGKAESAVKSVSDAATDSDSLGGKAADAAESVSDIAPNSSNLGGKAEGAVQTVSDAASDTVSTAKDTAAAVQSASAPSEKDVIDSQAAQSVSESSSKDEASNGLKSVGDKVQDSASSTQQFVSDNVSEPAEASSSVAGGAPESTLQTVSDKAPDAEGAQAAELASKAADTVTEKLPNSMGGKDKLENVAPDSVPGKFEGAVDNLASKLPGQPEQNEQSAQSAPAAEMSNLKSDAVSDSIVREISDNISESVGPITPSKGQESAEGQSNSSIGNVLTSVSNKVSGATNDALDQAESSFGANPVEQVSAGAEAASRDAGKDATNPANTGISSPPPPPSPLPPPPPLHPHIRLPMSCKAQV